MWTKIKGWLASPVFEDEDKTRTASLLNVILLTFLAIFVVLIVVALVVSVDWEYVLAFVGVLILSSLSALILMRIGRVKAASIVFCIMLWTAFTVMSFFAGGVSGPAYNILILIVFITGVLLGWRVGAAFAGLSILVGIGLLYAENNGLLPPSLLLPLPIVDLVNRTIIFSMVIALVYVTSRSISQALDRANRQERHLEKRNHELEVSQKSLTARTQGLELVTTLNERLAGILDFEQLLEELVNQVKEGFGFYHAHIYILEEQRQDLIMTAGTGKAGVQMKAQGHQIALNAPTSLVARVARSGQVVNVSNVRETPDWLPNPLLPNTYSEMAVPIIVERQVVGVLDVQQDKINGFDEADANLLRSLSNQVAVAIRNAQLFNVVETALAEAKTAQERYVTQAWNTTTRAREQENEYLYVRPDMFELSEATLETATQKALAQKHPAIVAIDEYEGSPKPLVAPVSLGGQTIGTLQLHKMDSEDTRRLWTQQDLDMVEAILDQVALTAENLRLFDETRERAGREATIREITDKLRAAPNIDSLLETAARELGARLGVKHTVLELGIEIDHTDGNGKVNGAEGEA